MCGENPANKVDHINSLKQDWESGGWSDEPAVRTARVNDPGNLTGACTSCNASKGASPIGSGRVSGGRLAGRSASGGHSEVREDDYRCGA